MEKSNYQCLKGCVKFENLKKTTSGGFCIVSVACEKNYHWDKLQAFNFSNGIATMGTWDQLVYYLQKKF